MELVPTRFVGEMPLCSASRCNRNRSNSAVERSLKREELLGWRLCSWFLGEFPGNYWDFGRTKTVSEHLGGCVNISERRNSLYAFLNDSIVCSLWTDLYSWNVKVSYVSLRIYSTSVCTWSWSTVNLPSWDLIRAPGKVLRWKKLRNNSKGNANLDSFSRPMVWRWSCEQFFHCDLREPHDRAQAAWRNHQALCSDASQKSAFFAEPFPCFVTSVSCNVSITLNVLNFQLRFSRHWLRGMSKQMVQSVYASSLARRPQGSFDCR